MRRTYATLTMLAAVLGLALAMDLSPHASRGPAPRAVITGEAQGFTVTFPDGSSLPVSVSTATASSPPSNLLHPHTVTFGTNPASQFKVTLTPGSVTKPSTGPTGDTGTTSTTTTSTSTTATSTTTSSTSSNVPPGQVTFQATFANQTLAQFKGAQCANTGQASQVPRLRGTLTYATVAGQAAAVITLPPASSAPTAGFTLVACNMNTPPAPVTLPSDQYLGLMVYIPQGFTIPNGAFYGVNMYELHFENIWAAPVILQLHNDSVVIALETGACQPHGSSNPGCDNRSNAGHPPCQIAGVNCLPGYYAIPPGKLAVGWNEIVLHVHWAADSTGAVDSQYRTIGGTWQNGDSVSGIPTVQWPVGGSPGGSYIDSYEAYTAALSAPLTVTLGKAVDGTTFQAVAGLLP